MFPPSTKGASGTWTPHASPRQKRRWGPLGIETICACGQTVPSGSFASSTSRAAACGCGQLCTIAMHTVDTHVAISRETRGHGESTNYPITKLPNYPIRDRLFGGPSSSDCVCDGNDQRERSAQVVCDGNGKCSRRIDGLRTREVGDNLHRTKRGERDETRDGSRGQPPRADRDAHHDRCERGDVEHRN